MLDPKRHHNFERHKVTTIKCLKCNTVQPKSNTCQKCEVQFAKYYCGVCVFFDDKGIDKKIFHCDKCGICRVGPSERFFHCDKCGMCLNIAMKDNHMCKEQAYKEDCPVCLTDLHTSREVTQIMRCGHIIHCKCMMEYLRTNVACPLCKKSMVDPALFEASYDQQIAAMPMPEEYKHSKVVIICNDCSARTKVKWHIMGGKCG